MDRFLVLLLAMTTSLYFSDENMYDDDEMSDEEWSRWRLHRRRHHDIYDPLRPILRGTSKNLCRHRLNEGESLWPKVQPERIMEKNDTEVPDFEPDNITMATTTSAKPIVVPEDFVPILPSFFLTGLRPNFSVEVKSSGRKKCASVPFNYCPMDLSESEADDNDGEAIPTGTVLLESVFIRTGVCYMPHNHQSYANAEKITFKGILSPLPYKRVIPPLRRKIYDSLTTPSVDLHAQTLAFVGVDSLNKTPVALPRGPSNETEEVIPKTSGCCCSLLPSNLMTVNIIGNWCKG